MSRQDSRTELEVRHERFWAFMLGILDLAYLGVLVAMLAGLWVGWRLGFPEVLDVDLLRVPEWMTRNSLLKLSMALVASAAAALQFKVARLRSFALEILVSGVFGLAVAVTGRVYRPGAVFSWHEVMTSTDSLRGLTRELEWGWGAVLLMVVVGRGRVLVQWYESLKGVGTHGSARFATLDELRKVGLSEDCGPRGIFVGIIEGIKYFINGEQHASVVAQTGGGKTTCCIVPTMLYAKSGMVVFDPKSELFRLTAWWRRLGFGQRIYRLDAADETQVGLTNSINPLDLVEAYPGDVAGVQRLAEYFVPSRGTNESNEIWNVWGRQVFVALCLHVLYAETNKTLQGVVQLFSRHSFRDLWKVLLYSAHDPDYEYGFVDGEGKATVTHPYIRTIATQMLGLDSRQLGGIQSTMSAALNPLYDEVFLDTFSSTDIDIDAILGGKATLYVTSNPVDVKRIAGIVHMLLSYLCARQTERVQAMDGDPGETGLFVILEEMFSLGRFPSMELFLSILRSYGVRFLYVLQGVGQAVSLYGPQQTVTKTTPLELCYGGPEDLENAVLMSRRMGSRTIEVESRNRSMRGGSLTSSSSKRALMEPEEIQQMERGQGLLMPSGSRAARFDAVNVYLDEEMSRRVEMRGEGEVVCFDPQASPWREYSGVSAVLEEARQQFDIHHPKEG